MKLVRFDGGRLGVLQAGRVHDITALVGDDPAQWPPVGMLRLIRSFAELRPRIEAHLGQSAGVPLDSVRLDAPLVWPHNLFAYPVNYVLHGEEMASPNIANKNGFFLKATSSISGPADPIVLPAIRDADIHHECELGLVIGKGGRHITRETALDHIFGYCCLVDVTIRGKQERVMRKSFDSFTPIGPAIVTADEVGDADHLGMKLWVNDELRQDANTRDLIVDIREIVVMAASAATLEPGDLIATGTPAGVGPIKAGDTVRIEIEKVGAMSLDVIQGQGGGSLAMPA